MFFFIALYARIPIFFTLRLSFSSFAISLSFSTINLSRTDTTSSLCCNTFCLILPICSVNSFLNSSVFSSLSASILVILSSYSAFNTLSLSSASFFSCARAICSSIIRSIKSSILDACATLSPSNVDCRSWISLLRTSTSSLAFASSSSVCLRVFWSSATFCLRRAIFLLLKGLVMELERPLFLRESTIFGYERGGGVATVEWKGVRNQMGRL